MKSSASEPGLTVYWEAYLEHMECLKLDIPALVSEQVHHKLQVFRIANVLGHHSKVMAIQQELTKKLRTTTGYF